MRWTFSMIGTRQARPPNTTREPTLLPSARRCWRPEKMRISDGRHRYRKRETHRKMNSTNAAPPPPKRSALLVSESQSESCCTSDDESIPSSSGSIRRYRRRRARDDRDVAAHLHDHHVDAGLEHIVVVRFGEQIHVTAARNPHSHLAALGAGDRQQQAALAADQRGR